MRQDTLRNRIDGDKDLTENEIDALVNLLGHGCMQKTKDRLERRLALLILQPNYGIYGRVLLSPRLEYCAGQSYTDEIKTVRNLLLKG